MKKMIKQKMMFLMMIGLVMMSGSAYAGDNQNAPRFIIVPPGVMIPVYHQRPRTQAQPQAQTQVQAQAAQQRARAQEAQKQQKQAYDSQLNTMFLILAR